MQQFQFDRRPQPVPGTREDTIHKAIPQLRKGRFHPLAQRTDQRPLVAGLGGGQQQQVGFVQQQVLELFAPLAPIG